MRRSIVTLLCLLGTLAPASEAAAEPGDLFVTESEGGSVLEFSDGGDLSGATRYATGLSTPVGICRGPGGHIYVLEYASGEITIIPEGGGDLTTEDPFAYNLVTPTAFWCDDERILTATFFGGDPTAKPPIPPSSVVLDVTAGENVLEIDLNVLVVNQNSSLSTAVVIDDSDSMFVVGGDAFDITGNSNTLGEAPYASGGGLMVPAILHDGLLLAGQYQDTGVLDFTAGGDLSGATPWATLPFVADNGVEALLDAGELGVFALVNEAIYDITGGGDFSAASPFAEGLNSGIAGEGPIPGLESMLHHICSTNDDCADDDLCNGDELCINNECVDPAGPADCDDEDVCTSDSCTAEGGCANEPVENCCHDDFDCEIDEVCDGGTNQCVPTDPTAGGEDDSSGDSAGESGTDGEPTSGGSNSGPNPDPTAGTAPGGEGSESDTDDPGAIEGGEGCACTTAGTPNSPAFLLLVAAGLFLRPRRRRR